MFLQFVSAVRFLFRSFSAPRRAAHTVPWPPHTPALLHPALSTVHLLPTSVNATHQHPSTIAPPSVFRFCRHVAAAFRRPLIVITAPQPPPLSIRFSRLSFSRTLPLCARAVCAAVGCSTLFRSFISVR
eukprot:EW706400.1.p1 GENE.EW706400.1~~EW706400.1.p1  ORF type:complete len:129 (+),score=14.96 EW706400.1:155-541(+)